ncbi:MAG: MFS transporter [Rhodobiaceae bacterium]|nr:MFS transporter [Rhodobiaceae bacterium]MCC0049459.1 MFS transporter [Rhodobiaceae bacterium]
MMSATPSATTSSWRTPALIIIAGVLIAIVTNGPRTAMGLFLPPMTEANGWSRETFALALALQNIVWGMAQPIAGGFADKYGTSRVIIAGTLVYAVSFLIMSQADAPFILHLSAGVMMGAAIGASSFGIVITAFSRLLPPERRQVGFGIATAGGSLGQFLFAPITQGFISAYGWHTALILLGAMVLAVVALAPVLAGKSEKSPHVERDQAISEALKEAFSERSYVLLLVGFFVCGFQVAFISAHLPAYLVDLGLAAKWGAWSIALIGLFNVIGSYSAGLLSGKRSKPHMLSWIYLLRAIAFAVFLLVPISVPSVLIFSSVIGLLWLSTVPPTSGIVVTMFGPRWMGLLWGLVFLNHQVGSFLGVWLGGRLYDQTGSYDVVWWLGVALGLVAAVIHWPIRDTPVARLNEAAS